MADLPRCRCGGEAKVYHMPTHDSDSYFIACPTCERATGWFSKESDAEKCWLSMHPAISQADAERLLELGRGTTETMRYYCREHCRHTVCSDCSIKPFIKLVERLTKERETP